MIDDLIERLKDIVTKQMTDTITKQFPTVVRITCYQHVTHLIDANDCVLCIITHVEYELREQPNGYSEMLCILDYLLQGQSCKAVRLATKYSMMRDRFR